MKQYIEIRCRYCGAGDLVKNGRGENGAQRCRRSGYGGGRLPKLCRK